METSLLQLKQAFQHFDFSGFIKNLFLYSESSPLIFTRFYFWGFFAVVLALYSFFYKKNGVRNSYLYLVSLFFYYKTSGIFVLLVIFVILLSFLSAYFVHRAKKKGWKKLWLTLGVLITLLLLAYYKYTYFILSIINNFVGTPLLAENILGSLSNNIFGTHFDASRIFLPIGISFFSFQAISYIVDVYRNKLDPVKRFSDYGFYITFFPQLVAGPIVRASEFIPQMTRTYNLSKDEFGYGIYMILKGMVKKLVFADYIAINFIDRVFDNPLAYSGFESYMALIGYSLQVYCDFSGYTDIAIGTAQLLGFKVPTNFNSPYKALSVAEFWKRWHISLSTWLKDYLYIPLGGNKHGWFRTNLNLMLTMLIGGLWHGADIKFIIWGGLNGLGLLVYKGWRKISFYEKYRNNIVNIWKIFLTFSFISFTRIFFRADNMEIVNAMLFQLSKGIEWELVLSVLDSYKIVFIIILIGFIFHWLSSSRKEYFRGLFIKAPLAIKILISVIVILLVYQSVSAEMQAFIYFQF